MNTLVPVDNKFIEQVAKSIGRERLYRDAVFLVENATGTKLPLTPEIEDSFDHEFELLWACDDPDGVWNREQCIADAQAAINKINFLLLTTPE